MNGASRIVGTRKLEEQHAKHKCIDRVDIINLKVVNEVFRK